MRPFYLFIFALLFCVQANCQIPYTLNIQSIYLPSGFSAISFNENQYITDSTLKYRNTFSTSYQPSRFGLAEISPISLSYRNNMISNLSINASFEYFGFELYNEFAAGVGAVTKLKYLEIGGKITFHNANVKDYGNSSAISFDLFSRLNLHDNLAFAVLLENINRAYYSNANRTVPQSAIFSIGWLPFKNLGIDIGTNIDLNTNASIIAGMKYKFNQYLEANVKCNSSPFLIITGVNLSALDYLNILFYLRYEEDFGYDEIIGIEIGF